MKDPETMAQEHARMMGRSGWRCLIGKHQWLLFAVEELPMRTQVTGAIRVVIAGRKPFHVKECVRCGKIRIQYEAGALFLFREGRSE